MSGPRIAELCAGYGGLSMAVVSVLGGELVLVADNDPGASQILAYRYPLVPNLGDITTADFALWRGQINILCAGFPCQDISSAGKRAGLKHGTRSGVWHHVARAIGEARPPLVLIENVRALLTARGDEPSDEHLAAEAAAFAALRLSQWLERESRIAASKGDTERGRRIAARTARALGLRRRALARCEWHERRLVRAVGTVLGSLASLGYDARWVLVSAAEAGAPHLRERIFILAWPAADAGGQQPERRGVPGVLGSPAAAEPREARQRQRPGNPAGDGGSDAAAGRPVAAGSAAEDADSSASGERRLPAPGQAESGRSRADAGRPGRAHAAADTESGRRQRKRAGSERPGGDAEPDRPASADAEGNGRLQGGAEPAGIIGGPDAPVRSHGTAADSESGPGVIGHGDDVLTGREADGRRQAAGRSALADAERGGSDGRAAITERGPQRGDATGRDSSRRGGGPAAADPDGGGLEVSAVLDGEPPLGPADGSSSGRHADGHPGTQWGAYEPAIRRWESVTGRPVPRPTEPGRTGERLSPRFVEWMQGLPDGWVTTVPGLSRTDQLKALGNGVVPQQCALALSLLLPSWLDAIEEAA